MTFKSALLGVVLAVSACAVSAQATETHCRGHEANLKAVEEMTDVLFNQRDVSQVGRFYAPQFVTHSAQAGAAGATIPSSFMEKMWVDSKATFPDRKLVNELIVCTDDIVMVRLVISGTMKGPLGALPPTGKHFSTSATDIYRMKDGKVVEWWGDSDQLAIMRQLGLLQTLAAAEN